MSIAYIGLGSNLGRRAQNIQRAVRLLRKNPAIFVKKISSLYETAPEGPPQPYYVNAVVKLQTKLSPEYLFYELQKIEQMLKRVRSIQNGPRTIDLDILLYDRKKIRTKILTIPHPRMFQRVFVLKPLLELEPRLFTEDHLRSYRDKVRLTLKRIDPAVCALFR